MLQGKVCLITGCSRGIGKSIVEVFASKGAVVYAGARTAGSLDDYCGELSERYDTDVVPLYFDITDSETAREAFRRIKKERDKLDVLVNNAAIPFNQLFEMTAKDDLRKIFETNVFALFEMIQLAVRYMKRKRAGSIINISSTVGLDGNSGQAAYGATKGAVNAITKTAAKEFSPYHIRVNAVAPGLVETEMLDSASREKLQERASRIMLGRLAAPEDIARCCAFLASDEADYITGQIIKVDGCMLM